MRTNNFKKISVSENRIILEYQDKESKEISFSEIRKIYIKVKKVPLKYILLFVCLSLCVEVFLVWIYGFSLFVLSPSFLILVGVILLKRYKKYVLKIKLNDGYFITEPIPLELKHKTIEAIIKVRKAVAKMR
jgi:CRISPR/Cas system-associated endonuclease Cas1